MSVIGKSCHHPSSREQQSSVFPSQPQSHMLALPCLSPTTVPWHLQFQMREEQTPRSSAFPAALTWRTKKQPVFPGPCGSLDQALCCFAASSPGKNISRQLWHLMVGPWPQHPHVDRTQLWASPASQMHLEASMNFRFVFCQLSSSELLHMMAFLKASYADKLLPDCFSSEPASK